MELFFGINVVLAKIIHTYIHGLVSRRTFHFPSQPDSFFSLRNLRWIVEAKHEIPKVRTEEECVDLRCGGLWICKPIQRQENQVMISENSRSVVQCVPAFSKVSQLVD